MQSLLKENHGGKVIFGGEVDLKNRFVQPTLVLGPRMDSKMMSEEIFGPILPVVEYGTISDTIDWCNANPKPLSIYYFGFNSDFFTRL